MNAPPSRLLIHINAPPHPTRHPVVHVSNEGKTIMFKSIIVGFDGSDQSEHALKMACDMAKAFGSSLHLVHAPEYETTAMALGASAYVKEPSDEEIQRLGAEVMARAVSAASAAGVKPASVTVARGNAANVVLKRAKTVTADLIVTGRRGLGGLGSLVLGSTSLKIAHDAECPVLTVR